MFDLKFKIHNWRIYKYNNIKDVQYLNSTTRHLQSFQSFFGTNKNYNNAEKFMTTIDK